MARRKKSARASRPSEAVYEWYRKELLSALRGMDRATRKKLYGAWGFYGEIDKVEDPLFRKALLGVALKKTSSALPALFAELADTWRKHYDTLAERVAGEFLKRVNSNSYLGTKVAMQEALKAQGFALPTLARSPRVKTLIEGLTRENTALIKSIPRQYLGEVQKSVQECVEKGRDLQGLKEALLERYDITARRAEIISRDQNNKANGQLTRARYRDMGIKKAVWMHIGGVYQSRPTHEAMDGKVFNIDEGLFDDDPHVMRNVQPGELILCGCLSRPVIEGFPE